MKHFLLIFITPILFACSTSTTKDTEEATTDSVSTELVATTSPVSSYTILHQSQPGNFKNFDILINSDVTEFSDVMSTAYTFKALECNELPCNVVAIWNSKKAYELYEKRQDDAKWRKKNWVYLCEHYVADYNGSVKLLDMFPFMDSDYRKWGGTKKRPDKVEYDMP